jgi:hypothetical protein
MNKPFKTFLVFATFGSIEVDFFLWERHLAAMIVAGSHSHKGDTSFPAAWRRTP